MACRNVERAEAAKKEIVTKYGSSNPECVKIDVADDSVIPSLSAVTEDQLIIEQLDLSSLQSVRDFAKRINSTYHKLDFLINNAGATHGQYETTVDGFESTLGTNHLGPFLLTELLLPLLKNAAPSRIIMVSSKGHLMGQLNKPDLQIPKEQYGLVSAYNQSKLCNAMHACELSKRLEGSGVVAVSLHPGVVNTRILDTDNSFTAFQMCHKTGGLDTTGYLKPDWYLKDQRLLVFQTTFIRCLTTGGYAYDYRTNSHYR
ncbi:unnamed protein product [Calicophoron daubneyi]|uniref:Uncharacterized protein n=1 Tax=Calicophoron daubneyi TaxID=300641 RepID=A0AAV2T503_CALDB